MIGHYLKISVNVKKMNQNSFDLCKIIVIGDIAFVQGSSFYQECFNMWDANELDRICKNKHNPGKKELF